MYEIYLGGLAVGTAQVRRQGLYYHICCSCDFSGEVMYRLQVRCGDNCHTLGIPVPENGKFVLKTQIPVKKLGEDKLTFQAVPKHADLTGKFIPLSPEEPFRYLCRLQEAVLQVRDGKVGVVIKEL